MKKYISKPKEPIEVTAIQVSEENRAEIEKTFKDILIRFFYHNEYKMIYGKDIKDEKYNKLGCFIFIHDAHCAVYNGDYIITLKNGMITAKEKDVFEKEFEIIC